MKAVAIVGALLCAACMKSYAYGGRESGGVDIVKFNASKGGFGTVMIASFTLKNTNPYAIKDFDWASPNFSDTRLSALG